MVLPISNDCTPGGVCDERGKLHQCMWNNFCVIGGPRVPLREIQGQYTANAQGEEARFGWDDESTGATLREEGPNAGTWILPPAVYEEPTGPNGFRVTVGGYPVALECTMGVDCIDDLGMPCDSIASPTPDSALIALPIN